MKKLIVRVFKMVIFLCYSLSLFCLGALLGQQPWFPELQMGTPSVNQVIAEPEQIDSQPTTVTVTQVAEPSVETESLQEWAAVTIRLRQRYAGYQPRLDAISIDGLLRVRHLVLCGQLGEAKKSILEYFCGDSRYVVCAYKIAKGIQDKAIIGNTQELLQQLADEDLKVLLSLENQLRQQKLFEQYEYWLGEMVSDSFNDLREDIRKTLQTVPFDHERYSQWARDLSEDKAALVRLHYALYLCKTNRQKEALALFSE